VTSPHPLTSPQDRNRWRPIAADLRKKIRSGDYAPGDRLPSNAALRARYGVAGQTVQHAMNSLRSEGLVETRPGLGWFARKPPDVVRLPRRPEPVWRAPRGATNGLFGCPADEDAWLRNVVTVLRFDAASARIARELGIEHGAEILVRERTMSENGEVVALASSYFPRSLTRGTVIEAEDTGPGGALACLIRLGHHVVRHVERVTAGVAHDEEARRFGRPDRPVVFRMVRITSGRTAVLGVIHIVVLADRFELCYELPVTAR
jgi:GntR family transcriptional regulator